MMGSKFIKMTDHDFVDKLKKVFALIPILSRLNVFKNGWVKGRDVFTSCEIVNASL